MCHVNGRIERRLNARKLLVKAIRNHDSVVIRLDSPDDPAFWLEVAISDEEIEDINNPKEVVA